MSAREVVLFVSAAAVLGIGWVLRQRVSPLATSLLAWVPLHLGIAATGGVASPLIPLAAAWVVAVGGMAHRLSGWAATGAGLLLVGAEWLHGGTGALSDVARLFLLLGLAAVFPHVQLRRRDPTHAIPREAGAGRADMGKPAPESASATLTAALEVVRRASDASEAVLWLAEPGGAVARQVACASLDGIDPPEEWVPLSGHPYGWSLLERVHVHLDRGRKELPRPWAAEMLLIPVAGGDTLLSLAYHGVVPPGSGEAAVAAGAHLSELIALLQERSGAARDAAGVRALTNAVQSLPSADDTDSFAKALIRAAFQTTATEGAAVALWDADTASGRVVYLAGEATGIVLPASAEFRDDDSWLALACKHGTELHYHDISSERRPLPLCTPGETWTAPPRSVLIQPIRSAEALLGALVLWHSRRAVFQEQDRDSIRLLCSVAAPSLQGVLNYEALGRRAAADALTGLPNRGSFDSRFASACAHFQRYGRPFSLIVLDIDHFKKFNDTWGHEAGDRVLQHVASLIRSSIREVDHPARLGGEEFVVLLPETTLEHALPVAERIRATLHKSPVAWNGRSLSVTASLGVATCPETAVLATDVLAAADAALYRSKETGRNRVSAAPPIRSAGPPNSPSH